ncbi:MAG: O-antigen ligase family protein [Anaerolineales bacterium]
MMTAALQRAPWRIFSLVSAAVAAVLIAISPDFGVATITLAVAAGVLAVVLLEWPVAILVGLAAFLPYEDFLLKWLPVSTTTFLFIRLGSELLLYGLLTRVVIVRMARGQGLRRTPLDIPIVLFVLIALGTLVASRGALFGGILNIRVLLRYVAVFYVVVNMDLSAREIRWILGAIVAAGVVEGAIALAQFVGGPSLQAFFSPPLGVSASLGELDLTEFANTLKIGAVAGTIGKPAALGLFLIVAVTIALALWQERSLNLIYAGPGILVMIAGVVVTYKRGELLLMALAFALFLLFNLRLRSRIYSLIGIVLVLVIAFTMVALSLQQADELIQPREQQLGVVEHFQQLLTRNFWAHTAQFSRGWLLVNVGGHMIQEVRLIGYGSDTVRARELLIQEDPSLERLTTFKVFEDVYWVAMLVYYGILGMIVFLTGYARTVWNILPSIDRPGINAAVGTAAAIIAIVTLPAAFLERVFELRAYSFYLWLLMGLAISLVNRSKMDAAGAEALDHGRIASIEPSASRRRT